MALEILATAIVGGGLDLRRGQRVGDEALKGFAEALVAVGAAFRIDEGPREGPIDAEKQSLVAPEDSPRNTNRGLIACGNL